MRVINCRERSSSSFVSDSFQLEIGWNVELLFEVNVESILGVNGRGLGTCRSFVRGLKGFEKSQI